MRLSSLLQNSWRETRLCTSLVPSLRASLRLLRLFSSATMGLDIRDSLFTLEMTEKSKNILDFVKWKSLLSKVRLSHQHLFSFLSAQFNYAPAHLFNPHDFCLCPLLIFAFSFLDNNVWWTRAKDRSIINLLTLHVVWQHFFVPSSLTPKSNGYLLILRN